MKIHTLNPSGCHRREIKALIALQKNLPPDWFAYASLEMVGNEGGEIDLIICAKDRLIAVEVKDWNHPIEDLGQKWSTAGRITKSPVISIREKSKYLAGRLKRHLTQKHHAPWVDSCVLLTGRATRNSLSEESKEKTFDLEFFLKIGSPEKFLEAFPSKGNWLTTKKEVLNSTEIGDLRQEIDCFFKGKSNFIGATRSYNDFKADEDFCFKHPQSIYSEFFAKKPSVKGSNALLRVWDFEVLSEIDGAYREESNRKTLAFREEDTIGFLKEKNPMLSRDNAFLTPISSESRDSVSSEFFELYDLPWTMKRLREASNKYKGRLKLDDRVGLATMLISRVAELHEIGVAHRDIGDHNVWVDVPKSISLSGFATAYVPEEKTISQVRTTIKANSGTLPEDFVESASDHFRKDVFLLAVSVHQIIFGDKPQLEDDVYLWKTCEGEEGELFGCWFEKALDWEPGNRYSNAGVALDAFKLCIKFEQKQLVSLKSFDQFKRDRMIFPNMGTDQMLLQSQELLHFKTCIDSECRQIKLWMGVRFQEANEEGNAHLLQFLERCLTLQKRAVPALQKIVDFGLIGMGMFVELEWAEGETLEAVDLSGIQEEALVNLVSTTIEVLWELHRAEIYHTDIKPSNILVSLSEDGESSIKLIDILDYAPVGADRVTPLYLPEEGDSVPIPARDGFALRKTLSELLNRDFDNVDEGFLERLEDCLAFLYAPEVANPDFEGVTLSIMELMSLPTEVEDEMVTIRSKFFKESLILKGDERGLPINISDDRENDEKCRVQILTPTCKLNILVDRNKREAERCWVQSSSEGEYAGAMNYAKGYYTGSIHLICDLEVIDLEQVSEVYKDCDLSVSQSRDSRKRMITNDEEDLVNKTPQLLKNEEKVDVAALWRAIIDAEEEVIPVVTVESGNLGLGSSTEYHLVVSAPAHEVDSRDWVDVELEAEVKGGWKFIGKMNLIKSDISRSDVGKLVFSNNSPKFYPPRKGSRIRMQDKRAKMSYERRKKAAERILEGRSTARSLMAVFEGKDYGVADSVEFSDVEFLPHSYGLNEVQSAALLHSLKTAPLSLIQGPPGTGKTRVIAAAVHFIATQKPSSRILVVSQSHEAVNNATDQIVRLFDQEGGDPSLVRVGKRSTLSDDLISYHSESIQATYRNFFKEHLSDRVSPVGVELGLPQELVQELTVVKARLTPLFEELKRSGSNNKSGGDESKTETDLSKRIVQVCEQHTADELITDDDPAEAYEELVELLITRYGVTNRAAIKTLTNVIELALDWVKILESPVNGFDSYLVDTRQVITGTCVGVGRWNLGIEKKNFDWVIIDEAARCGPGELSVAMQVGHQVMLVGDHKQLPPHVDREIMSKVTDKLNCSNEAVMESDFHRVFTSPLGEKIARSLNTQYRMIEAINSLVSDCFYPEIGGLDTGRGGSPEQYNACPDILGSEVTWLDTGPISEACESAHYTSFVNNSEVEKILEVLKYIDDDKAFVEKLHNEMLEKGGEASIGIITAYKAQANLIQEQLWVSSISQDLQSLCKIDTVDSYQGKENPIIIFSPTRTNKSGKCGHTVSEERINVSLSRAQERLLIVGSHEFWSNQAKTPMGRVNHYIINKHDSGDSGFKYTRKAK